MAAYLVLLQVFGSASVLGPGKVAKGGARAPVDEKGELAIGGSCGCRCRFEERVKEVSLPLSPPLLQGCRE